MPLSRYGLWEADSTTPRSKSSDPARYATAGVGTTPALTTSAPCGHERRAPARARSTRRTRACRGRRESAPADRAIARERAPRRRGDRGRIERPHPGHAADAIGAEQPLAHSGVRPGTIWTTTRTRRGSASRTCESTDTTLTSSSTRLRRPSSRIRSVTTEIGPREPALRPDDRYRRRRDADLADHIARGRLSFDQRVDGHIFPDRSLERDRDVPGSIWSTSMPRAPRRAQGGAPSGSFPDWRRRDPR